MSERVAWLVFLACAVVYLLILPSLPDADGAAENVMWALSLMIAIAGIVALVLALRQRLGRGRTRSF
jgi:hypothetical protein